jgi:hypothetical protein
MDIVYIASVYKDNKFCYGLIDNAGAWTTLPIYQSIYEMGFYNCYKVYNNNVFELINSKGEKIIESSEYNYLSKLIIILEVTILYKLLKLKITSI